MFIETLSKIDEPDGDHSIYKISVFLLHFYKLDTKIVLKKVQCLKNQTTISLMHSWRTTIVYCIPSRTEKVLENTHAYFHDKKFLKTHP